MSRILAIALGGSFGALSRYFVSKMIANFTGGSFPWGTLTVNAVGAFILGFLYVFFDRLIVPDAVKSFMAIGFLGAFTTFSTFALESVNLFRDGEIKYGIMNILLNNVIGIIAVLAGLFLARFIFTR